LWFNKGRRASAGYCRYSGKYYSFHDAREQMATITKKELIDRIAEKTQAKRIVVKRIVQSFLDEVIDELAQNNRLEFRDFGVFETRTRAARVAQNPKTLERVHVPAKRTIKFKMGRLMKQKLAEPVTAADPD
jgi:integration host factor subunit beta